jgi:hypothetical protein
VRGWLLLVGVAASLACRPVTLRSERLWVRGAVAPSTIDGAHPARVIVRVDAINWLPWPVQVQLGGPPWETLRYPPSTSAGQGWAFFMFGAEGRRYAPSASTWGTTWVRFGPWQAKRAQFDVWLNRPHYDSLPPGQYELLPSFGHASGRPIPFTVRRPI